MVSIANNMVFMEELYCKKVFRSMLYNADVLFPKDCINFLKYLNIKGLLTFLMSPRVTYHYNGNSLQQEFHIAFENNWKIVIIWKYLISYS